MRIAIIHGRLLAAAAALLVLSCAALALLPGLSAVARRDRLAAARQAWQSRTFTNYRMVLEDGACQMDYEVRSERVMWGYEVTCGRGNARSVSNLFELIQVDDAGSAACMGAGCICHKTTSIDARYHERLGYPTTITITSSAWPNWLSAAFWRKLAASLQNPCGRPTSRVLRVVNFIPRRQ